MRTPLYVDLMRTHFLGPASGVHNREVPLYSCIVVTVVLSSNATHLLGSRFTSNFVYVFHLQMLLVESTQCMGRAVGTFCWGPSPVQAARPDCLTVAMSHTPAPALNRTPLVPSATVSCQLQWNFTLKKLWFQCTYTPSVGTVCIH